MINTPKKSCNGQVLFKCLVMNKAEKCDSNFFYTAVLDIVQQAYGRYVPSDICPRR